ncbi:MAG: DUF4126 domain-containing protein [Verrucomicrobiota bacterium]
MENLLGICVGIGLAASCGFRVFVPLLITSIAAYSGHVQLAAGFEWLATPEAVTAFTVATLLEVGGYYVPWIDNALDSLGAPAAGIAGTILVSAMITDTSPFLQWALGIIAGGGVATATHVGFAAARGASSALTGGLANPVVATVENVGAVVMSVLSILVPVLVVVALIVSAVLLVPRLPQLWRWLRPKLTPVSPVVPDDVPPTLPRRNPKDTPPAVAR